MMSFIPIKYTGHSLDSANFEEELRELAREYGLHQVSSEGGTELRSLEFRVNKGS